MKAAGTPPGEIVRRFGFLRLGQAESLDAAIVGSKAATLSRLYRALPHRVPSGWMLPARQAAVFLEADEKGEGRALESLREAIGRTLAEEATASYAVRSSGLDEDSPEHSFAGQYETVLGTSGTDSLADAVRICARSCSAPRIDAYRRSLGGLGAQTPAVLLHEMVPAERAGVAFTSNPVSGDEEIVIDAGYGLGDLLVGGEITPDEFGVDSNGNVLWEKVGSKSRMSVLTARGVAQLPIPQALRRQASLTHDQLAAVAEVASLCRVELGYQADIEWAIAKGTVFVLQARPMTTGVARSDSGRDNL